MLAFLIGWSIVVFGWNIYWVIRDGINISFEKFFNSGWWSIVFWLYLLSGFIFLFFI